MKSPLFPLGATALVVLSAFLPIPVPAWALPSKLVAGEARLDLEIAAAWLTWGRGKVHLEGILLLEGEKNFFKARTVILETETRPGSSFLALRRLKMEGAEVLLDKERLDLLSGGEDAEFGPLAVEVEDLQFGWKTAAKTWRAQVFSGGGSLANGEIQLDASLGMEGLGARFALQVRGADRFQTWQIRVKGNQQLPRTVILASVPGLQIQKGELRLDGALDVEKGEVLASKLEFHLAGGEARYREPGNSLPDDLWKVEKVEAGIRGSLAGGFQAHATASWGAHSFSAQSLLLPRGDDWALHIRGEIPEATLDDAARRRLLRLDPGVGEVLEALNLVGASALGFGLDAFPGEPVQWAAAARDLDMELTYLGFLEADGDRPSFPYPVEELHGDVAMIPGRILLEVDGRMGGSPTHGMGIVSLPESGAAGLALDVGVDSLPVDARVEAALAGIPDAAAFWRELGSPAGGRARIDLRVRRASGGRMKVGLGIRGRVEGTRFRPLVLPVDSRLEGLDFSWTPGEASFHGVLSALGSQAQLTGDLWMPREADLPSLRVSARGEGLTPSDEDRQVLEDILGLPKGASDLSVSGPAGFQVDFFRPGKAKEPQILVAWTDGPLDLEWKPTETHFSGAIGKGAVVRTGGKTLLSFPWVESRALGGNATAGILKSTTSDAARALCRFMDVEASFGGPDGIELAGDATLEVLVSENFSASLHPRKLDFSIKGMTGRISTGRIRTTGTLPGVLNGEVEVEDATWGGRDGLAQARGRVSIVDAGLGDEGLEGVFALSDGSWLWSGMAFSNMKGIARKGDPGWILNDLGGDLLGGSFTPGKGAIGIPVEGGEGFLRLGFENLDLGAFRNWSGSDGQWSGKLDAVLDLRGPFDDPLAWKGPMSFHVTRGQLATVPVLSEIWKAVGVNPPLFRRGTLALQATGDGQLQIEDFELDHDLLAVEGKGSIGLDGYLDLKVSLNPFKVFRSVPLLSHAIDLLVEHDVYGPASSPRVTKHPIVSIQGPPLPRVPFPFWLPPEPSRSWLASPALRVEPSPLRD